MWENGIYQITTERDLFYQFERVMLTDSGCRFFIPMHFMFEDDQLCAVYECSGYAPLSSFRVERTEDALYIMEKTCLILHRAPEYLIDPERITLTSDMVFYQIESSDVRIAFLPRKHDSTNLRKRLILFLAELKKDIRDHEAPLLDQLARSMYYGSLDMLSLITQIGILRRSFDPQTNDAS